MADEVGSSDRDASLIRCATCGRAWRPPANARYSHEGLQALQWDLAREGWTLRFQRADSAGMSLGEVFCPEHAAGGGRDTTEGHDLTKGG
jgi:hypothetical protein